jgi:hypothetical protein
MASAFHPPPRMGPRGSLIVMKCYEILDQMEGFVADPPWGSKIPLVYDPPWGGGGNADKNCPGLSW